MLTPISFPQCLTHIKQLEEWTWRQELSWCTYTTAADVLSDTPGWLTLAMNALIVLLAHVAKFFSCANPDQQVAFWRSRLGRILKSCLVAAGWVLWLISGVTHYHCVKIDGTVGAWCHIVSNVPILVESCNMGACSCNENQLKTVITSVYGEVIEITPGLTFTLSSSTWKLVVNYLISISPNVQWVANTYLPTSQPKKRIFSPVLRTKLYI